MYQDHSPPAKTCAWSVFPSFIRTPFGGRWSNESARASAAKRASAANAAASASNNKRGLLDVLLKVTFLFPSALGTRHAAWGIRAESEEPSTLKNLGSGAPRPFLPLFTRIT